MDTKEEGKTVMIGVCAMEKKANSKAMTEMLRRLQEFPRLKTVVIPQKTILEEPVANWPICDCLISFHSDGFPLDKAKAYTSLRQPFLFNDLNMQELLQDRRKVYSMLQKQGITVPRYADATTGKNTEEFEDYITIDKEEFHKPFVEKPVSAEDHNIYMYFPSAAGGGSQRLFRKTGDKSSVYSAESNIRRDGKFIYEEFIPTDGTDVKVYTVGPFYAHAEARKSPGLDGKVYRDAYGKEQRYPVILTPAEKLIARKICLTFKQTVCGFDLLRANGKSYVCDVNGFSFVKTSERYYQDASRILAHMIFRRFRIPHCPPPSYSAPMSSPLFPSIAPSCLELRCVVAVIRHGDRTPKQKIKLQVSHPKFFELFEKLGGIGKVEVKLKTPNELQEVLDIVRYMLSNGEVDDFRDKFEQIRFVLEMNGKFTGINRKVELKSGKGGGSTHLDLVLKWGGELTDTGRRQAQALGRSFRQLYPLGRNCTPDSQGLGLLRLHSTFRHDLKIYASDEARVQMTAAAFAKGFLALEGELPPILAHMVKSANTNGLLGHRWEVHNVQLQPTKAKLFEALKVDREFTDADKTDLNPCGSISVAKALERVVNPRGSCREIATLVEQLLVIVVRRKSESQPKPLYHGETWDFIHRRWRKLFKDFEPSPGVYEPSKVTDIYDAVKYDLLHNKESLNFPALTNLFIKARDLSDIIMPQENGTSKEEKVEVGYAICEPLLKKIRADLQRNLEEQAVYQLDPEYSLGVLTPERQVRTRLYFTSQCHIHALLVVLLHAGPWTEDPQWQDAFNTYSTVSELDFLSQVVILLYEDTSQEPDTEERFHVEIHFSPGVARNASEVIASTRREQSSSHCSALGKSPELRNFMKKSDSLEMHLTRQHSIDHDGDLPLIHPLLTLHNALSHSQVDTFLQNITTRLTA